MNGFMPRGIDGFTERTKMKCSNVGCRNYDEDAKIPCAECQERERRTETKENRDRAWRIEQMKKHQRKDNNK